MRATRRTLTRFLTLAAVSALLIPASAGAVGFYIESAIGLAQLRGNDPFFGSGAEPTTSFGLGYDMGIFASFSDGQTPVELHFGLQPRYLSASGGESYSLLAAYPAVRLQLSRMYVAGGITNQVWKRRAPAAGFDALVRAESPLAYFGELGVLWPVTPDFTLGASGSAHYVNSGGTLSPSPALEFTMTMRFYLGYLSLGSDSKGASGRSSNEFKGWRYPFGHIK